MRITGESDPRQDTRSVHKSCCAFFARALGWPWLHGTGAVVARADQAEQALYEIAGLRRGRLRIFASQTIAAYWLPPLCHR